MVKQTSISLLSLGKLSCSLALFSLNFFLWPFSVCVFNRSSGLKEQRAFTDQREVSSICSGGTMEILHPLKIRFMTLVKIPNRHLCHYHS